LQLINIIIIILIEDFFGSIFCACKTTFRYEM
jgi:hypothetical protein